MKKMFTVLAVSLSTFAATSAMAGNSPYDNNHHYSHHQYDDYQHNKQQPRHLSKQDIKPARDWKAGQTLPRQFKPITHAVSYKDASRLYKPNHNQQWLKINGDYVLINKQNNKIVRIIA